MDERWRPSVTVAAVIEVGGRFLLVEEHTPEGLRLNNPAGHLEPGETPQEAVVREALEETGRAFEPEALLGVYLARFVREPADEAAGARPAEDITYLRFAYRGRVGEPLPGRALDPAIVRTVWMTRDEIVREQARHRSPLVMRCIDDHLAGRAHALDLVAADASVRQPFVLQPAQPTMPGMADEVNETAPEATPAASAAAPAEPLDAAEAPEAPEHSWAPVALDALEAESVTAPEPADAGAAAEQPPAPPAPPAPREPSLAETAAALAERFPALFAPGAPRPIKLRVQADIQARAPGVFTKKQLSIFLHRHTTSTAYIRALVELAQRFDLDGQPAGEVAQEHLDAAKVELERRREIAQQRRAAARPPRPPRAEAPAGADGAPPARPARRGGPPRADRPDRASGRGGPAGTSVPSGPMSPAGAAGRPPRPGPEGGRRPDRPMGGRPDRPPREGAGGQRPPRPPHRSGSPGERQALPRAPRQPWPERHHEADSSSAPAMPEDPARRERAVLLRSFEGSPLTAANFCALKGLALPEFESQIALARQERAERRAAEPAPPRRAP